MSDRLSQETIDYLYGVLDMVRKDFPKINFTIKYHEGMGMYCLRFDDASEYGYDDWQFEDLIGFNYFTPNNICLGVYSGGVENGVDIIETEIIKNEYRHTRK